MDNCPVGYVIFRALRDIYNFIPQISNIISLDEMELRYNLKGLWQYYLKVEDEFCKKLVNRDIYLGRPLWRDEAEHILRSKRRGIGMSNDSSIKLYSPVLGLDGKKLILFGAGRYADHFFDKYGEKCKIDFIVDNSNEKWGTVKRGVIVKSPDEIRNLIYGTYRIVITVANYKPIIEQLNSMGINEHIYRIYDRSIDDLLELALTDTMTDGKYNIGYVTGAFDMFHIGHLNILEEVKNVAIT